MVLSRVKARGGEPAAYLRGMRRVRRWDRYENHHEVSFGSLKSQTQSILHGALVCLCPR